MAWYPLANKKPIQPGPNDPPITVIGAILHVDAGDAKSLFNYFNGPSNGIESHFHIPKVGPVEQYRDTHYEADANLKGNSFLSGGRLYGYISIETQGLAKGEWNAHQIENIKSVLKWASETHNFPLRVCKTPQDPGVGYHTLFGSPSAWTPEAKVCPGYDRIRQFNNVLVPWFGAGAPAGGAAIGAEVITNEDVEKIAQAVYNKLEPRLKAYAADVKLFEKQTDAADAQRAADATVAKLKQEGLTK